MTFSHLPPEPLKTCVILNANAGSSEVWKTLQEALPWGEEVCWQSTAAGEGRRLAQQALDEGFERVIVAGGDGTINEVAGALLEAGSDVALGVLPLGTGNDLARTLGLPLDPEQALEVLVDGPIRAIDAIRVETDEQVTYAVNAAAGGFSGQVDEALTPELKKTWGPLAFLIGAATVLPDLQDYDTYLRFDDGEREIIQVYNVVVANGRTVGGGKQIAPKASPEDGLLDVVLVKQGTLVEMAEVSARLLAGNYLDSPHVAWRRARQVHVASQPGMWFNVDGELLTNAPVTFTIQPNALRVVVGPNYQPDVQSET